MGQAGSRWWGGRWIRDIWSSPWVWRRTPAPDRDGLWRAEWVVGCVWEQGTGGGSGRQASPRNEDRPDAQWSASGRRSQPVDLCSDDLCGAGLDRFVLALDRLAEALAQHPKLAQLLFRQVFVPIRQVEHSVVEPVLLVLRQGIDDAAAEDMAEQLVTRLREGYRVRVLPGFLLVHSASF